MGLYQLFESEREREIYKEERITLVTSLYFSKLYYGFEIWHLPEQTATQNKQLKFASANALRICDNDITMFTTHTEIHKMTGRALPNQIVK